SEATQHLMADIFGRRDLFDGLPRIERRAVAWGGESVTVPHSAVVIGEEELVRRLRPSASSTQAPAWTVFASKPLPPESTEHQFGVRTATASPVKTKGDGQTLWIESLSTGWLFLLPGWLLAVGGDVDALFAASRLIAPQIAHRGAAGAAWPAHPRIAMPLCGAGWL